MKELFKLIFQINFFIFPISAAFLTYRKLKGRPTGRFLRTTIMSGIMLMVSYIGIFVNETPEERAATMQNIERMLSEGEN